MTAFHSILAMKRSTLSCSAIFFVVHTVAVSALPNERVDASEDASRVHPGRGGEVQHAEAAKSQAQSEKTGERARNNTRANGFSGRWVIVDAIQDVINNASPDADRRRKWKSCHIQLMRESQFWNLRQVKDIAGKLKKQLGDRKQSTLATGQFEIQAAKRPLDRISGFFVLTESSGETLFCVLAFDVAKFDCWRIHHIQGSTRKNDLLFIEIGGEGARPETVAFRHIAELPRHE